MKKEVLNEIDIFHFWEELDFHYLNPQELNKKDSIYIEVRNQAYENNWALPRTITGWIYCEAWFSNMIEGQKGRFGATRLQYSPNMGKPIYLSGYDNSNNGASLWFVPEVSPGGDWPWTIRAEIKYTRRGLPEFARLYAE